MAPKGTYSGCLFLNVFLQAFFVSLLGMTLNQSKHEYQGAKPRLVQLTREKKNSDSAKSKSSKVENDEKLLAHKGLNRSLSWNALSPQSTTAPGWNFYGAEKLQVMLSLEIFIWRGVLFRFYKSQISLFIKVLISSGRNGRHSVLGPELPESKSVYQ